MCKHVAAVLYGVGARLDQQPELLFRLRRVDPRELVAQAGAGLPKARRGPAAGKVLEEERIADVFGIEMDGGAARVKVVTLAKARKQPPAKILAPAKKPRASQRR